MKISPSSPFWPTHFGHTQPFFTQIQSVVIKKYGSLMKHLEIANISKTVRDTIFSNLILNRFILMMCTGSRLFERKISPFSRFCQYRIHFLSITQCWFTIFFCSSVVYLLFVVILILTHCLIAVHLFVIHLLCWLLRPIQILLMN